MFLQKHGELKLVSHGRKLQSEIVIHDQIQDMVKGSNLFPLTTCNYHTIDKGLLSTFVERWHIETNTFHLHVGEMMITLDDMASLLHIPITGTFYNLEHMDKKTAILVLVDLLGVEYEIAFDEKKKTRGG